MADITKTTQTLKLLAGFADADDRTVSLDNPRDNVTEADIRSFETAAAPVLIGDKYGAAFTRFKTASVVNTTTKYLDLQ